MGITNSPKRELEYYTKVLRFLRKVAKGFDPDFMSHKPIKHLIEWVKYRMWSAKISAILDNLTEEDFVEYRRGEFNG